MFIIFPAVLPLVVKGMEKTAQHAARRWQWTPERTLVFMVAGYMLTSNALAVLYLLITRVYQYRSIESVKQLFS
jgi:hypothetical protein